MGTRPILPPGWPGGLTEGYKAPSAARNTQWAPSATHGGRCHRTIPSTSCSESPPRHEPAGSALAPWGAGRTASAGHPLLRRGAHPAAWSPRRENKAGSHASTSPAHFSGGTPGLGGGGQGDTDSPATCRSRARSGDEGRRRTCAGARLCRLPQPATALASPPRQLRLRLQPLPALHVPASACCSVAP